MSNESAVENMAVSSRDSGIRLPGPSGSLGSSLLRPQHAPPRALAHPSPLPNSESAVRERVYVVATEDQHSAETETGGGGGRFAPVGDVELDEDVGDVRAHGAGTDEEGLGDLLVSLVPGQQAQDV